MLTVRDLKVVIGGKTLVEGVSFTIQAGESFGLIGPSGSGKSTVLRAIAGLADYSGAVLFHGRNLKTMPRLERAAVLNMVFQDPFGALHPRHTVARALAEPLILLGQTDRPQKIEDALNDVGLPLDLADRYPHQLSGGQRQRVVIARALMQKPKLLLLDEPTSALDMTVQADILDLLEGLKASHGLTYLLVAHALPIVARLCGRIGKMENGRMVKDLPAGLAISQFSD